MSLLRRNKDEPPPAVENNGRNTRRRVRDTGREGQATPAEGADAQEQFIIDALRDLHDTVVREVMTPRVDIVALSIPVTVDAVSQAVRASGHSSFPVYGEDLDDLVGVLFVNDLFRAGWQVGDSERADAEGGRRKAPDPLDISRRLRQPFLVPESGLVLEVLAEMRRQRRAFAVVVDEHGGVEGVLTVKDLLGALVGDLPDEFDRDDEPEMIRVDSNRWLVDGRTSVDDVRHRLEINLPEGEYVTLGGYLFDVLGRIPEEGETWDVDGWELRVAEMDKRRIAKVVARRLPPPAPAARTPEGSSTDSE